MEERKEDLRPENLNTTTTPETPNDKPEVESMDDIVARMNALLDKNELPEKEDADRLAGYIFRGSHKEQNEELSEEQLEELKAKEASYLVTHNRYKELRAQHQEQLRKEIQDNTEKKGQLLEKMQELLVSTESFGKVSQEFRDIRKEWESLGEVDPQVKTDYLTRYQKLMEDFYEIKTITNEFRDYDFAKNKEIKEKLISLAKELGESEDVVSAFHSLQLLHDRWKETGPVAPDEREPMWKEFREASQIVNRRHVEHFENLRAKEKENLALKTQLCERAEALLEELPTTREGWNKGIQKVEELRKEWRSIGPVPRKHNQEIFKRFREATNKFFAERRYAAKNFRESINEKLEIFRRIEKEANELKDSQEWSRTAEKLMALQQEWKDVGGLGVRVAEVNKLWESFQSACNHFFENRKKEIKERDKQRVQNMEEKLQVIEELKTAVKEEKDQDTLAKKIEDIQKKWGKIGLVPNKHKDEINDKFYGTLREASAKTGKGKGKNSGARTFDVPVEEMSQDDLFRESRWLERTLERKTAELSQYETNLNFFSSSSGKKDPLIAPLLRKIENLRKDIEKLEERFKEIKAASK